MNAHYRLKFPEEIELESKEAELARLKETHRARTDALSRLKAELRTFERVYHQVIGIRVAELDALEAQLCGTAETSVPLQDELHAQTADEWSGHLHAADLLEESEDSERTGARSSLKALYREVAKAIHPDLAHNDRERAHREQLMSVANCAYAEGNREELQRILREWERSPGKIRCGNIGDELVRVIRQIARERDAIAELDSQVETLMATDTCLFKQRVDTALGNGIDLLAEMAATIDLNIASARKRLAALKGEPIAPGNAGTPFNTRLIRFPTGHSCGVLYTRSRESINYCDWQRHSEARGARSVPLHQAIRLDVRGDLTPDLRFLKALQQDDLQSLFMYEITDSALEYIAHLTGLEELYLSDSAFSDDGIGQLSALTSLKRLYLYHVNISDAGLAALHPLRQLSQFTCSGTLVTEAGLQGLQKAVPGVKTLSFPWRYGKK